MVANSYERQILRRISQPDAMTGVWLGGAAGADGGSGTPPGGYIGQLAQKYVAYDTTEAESSSGSASLVSNLNHIRQRIADLEAGGAGHIIRDESGPFTARTGLRFTGAIIDVTDDVGNDWTNVEVGYESYNESGDFPVACVTSGSDSIAIGNKHTVSGAQSGVLSGYYNRVESNQAVIAGGYNNHIQASSPGAAIGGGKDHTISNDYSTIAGGYGHTISAKYASVGGGYKNTVSGTYGAIAGGSSNVASQNNAFVGGGFGNVASGISSAVVVGYDCTASGPYSTVLGGEYAVADKRGQITHNAGRFAANGDAQVSTLVERIQTSGSVQAEMFLDGSSARCTIAADTTWMFDVQIAARRTDADNESAGYGLRGVIDSTSGSVPTTALVGAVDNYFTREDNAGWDAVAEADDANDALVLKVTGEAAKTIRWVARINLVEVTG